jgi:hypothetical protein
MAVTCPAGHVSATDDYCDDCGAPIQGHGGTNRSNRTEMISVAESHLETCPGCGAARLGVDRFCEVCGRDLSVPPVEAWIAVVGVDQRQYERTAPPELAFPGGRAEVAVVLDRDEVLIGRRSASRDVAPQIDLTGPLDDPAVSHRHARLVRAHRSGPFAVEDLGSTNGTSVNDAARRLEAHVPVELADGDRILLGAWTAITIRLDTD